MTQEEKARAYDEALKRAKYILHTVETAGCAMHKDLLTEIFPELAESEDERVIKALETFINQPEIADKITFEARIGWLAWLEKQKESLHIPESCKENADSFTSEGERIRKELIDAFSAYDIESSWNGIPVSSVIAWLEKQKEQKPEVNDPFDDEQFRRGYEAGKHDAMREQKPAEWSEEDERIRRNLMSLLANMRGDRITEETYQKYYPWLSALRPSWKPSEEQMIALENVIKCELSAGLHTRARILQTLQNDLKKL